MKAPLKWLVSYTDIEINGKEEILKFASDMTMSGTKVEGIENKADEIDNVVVGKCLELYPHENSDHLVICKMLVGDDTVLQIVTGAPNARVGAYIPVALDGATLTNGLKIKKGKLRGVVSEGMMCSFEELGLDHEDYPGGIDDGVIILQDLEDFKDMTDEDLDKLVGKDIMEVLGADESVIEFEVTSNRPDCFSITGLAREAAVTLNKKYIAPEISVKEEGNDEAKNRISVRIEDSDLCSRYIARVVTDVKIGPSPKWMRDRLQHAGIRAINNIVDITNYVMLEFGHPMHAFDRRFVRGDEIIVRRAKDGETMMTLDGVERKFDSSTLVIADKEGPIAVAGVMGGEHSGVMDDTKEVVFEAALFDPVSVRMAAKKLGMRTESSSRFEKGLNAITCAMAMERAVQLVEMLGAGKVLKGTVDCYPVPYEKRKVPFNVDRINELLGTELARERMIEILTSLEFEVCDDYVVPPHFRPDIVCGADVSEEIARFYGYNNIPSRLLTGCETTLGRKNRRQTISEMVRNLIKGLGYYEALTFSFESPSVFDMLNLPADSPLRKAVVISNPLGEDFSVMRTSMAPSMLKILSLNHSKRNESASVFEISYVYEKMGDDELPVHKELLSLAAYGDMSFFDIKGDIEALFDSLKIKDYSFAACKKEPYMHPGMCAKVYVNGRDAGLVGKVHPKACENFECPENSYLAFVELEPVVEAAVLIPTYKELPKFPAVTRDLAIVVDKVLPANEVEKVISQRGGKVLEELVLFDYYDGPQVPQGKKSLAYSLTFRDNEKTLTDEDVNKVMNKILNGLNTVLGAEIRN